MKGSFFYINPMLCEMQINLTEDEKLKAKLNSIQAEISYLTKKMNALKFVQLKKVSIYSNKYSRVFLFFFIFIFNN